MKQNSLFFIVLFICTVAKFSDATPLMVQGVTNTALDYQITDRSNASKGDTWNSAIGGYTSSDYTGVYLGTITNDNNDDFGDLLSLIRYFLDDSNYWITTVKVDKPQTTNDVLKVTYSNDNKFGTWSIIPSSDFVVDFYSIKGAKEYALYYVNPALQEGDWTTRHLLTPNQQNIPGISHITVVKDPPLPTPEPATMLLLGIGIAGLAAARRRKKAY